MIRTISKKIFGNKWIAWIWTFLILLACTWPGKSMPAAPIVGFDKLVHVSMFIGWAVLWLTVYPSKTWTVIIAGVLYGVGLEFYQQLLPFDRSFDWWDALADAVGVFAGFGFKTWILDRYLQRLY